MPFVVGVSEAPELLAYLFPIRPCTGVSSPNGLARLPAWAWAGLGGKVRGSRRAVDFEKRRAMLAGIREQDDADIGRMVQDLLATREDGKIKLFLIYRALKAKKAHREIFRSGAYLPLESAGRFRSHVIAFAWRHQRQWALIIAPKFLSHLIQEEDLPLGRQVWQQVWQDTAVIMPNGAPAAWRNVITSEVLSAGKGLPVGDVLLSFPVALLMGEGKAPFRG